MTLTPGMRLGPYEIVSAIGAGGMGEVYRARDSKLDRQVAIKVLPSQLAENATALARFEREAKAVAALSHPNILSIFDFGHEGDDRVRRHGIARRRDAAAETRRAGSRDGRPSSTACRSRAAWPPRTPRASSIAI